MKICGSMVRNVCVVAFDVAILVSFPCHSVESPWFWGSIAGVLGVSASTIIVLELTRLVAPEFVSGWWDNE